MLASSKVSAGLGAAALELFRPWDIIYILDFPILAFLFLKKLVKLDHRPFNKRASFAVTSLSVMLFSANLFLAEIDRPELLTWLLQLLCSSVRLVYLPFWVTVPTRLTWPIKNAQRLLKLT